MNTISLDRYQLLHSLGSGEFGETFLATDLHSPTQKKVVIKSLKPFHNQSSSEIIEKLFLREVSVLEDLGSHSTQIPTLDAYFCHDNQYYLVQEYIEGKNITELGVISSQQCCSILLSLLDTLKYVHSKNIIHRNIKPENIIIRDRDQLPVLTDFGAIKETMGHYVISTDSTLSSVVVMTRGFMAPEQSAGRAVFSTDIYALGLTMIYTLTGKLPIELPTHNITGELDWQSFVPNLDDQLRTVLEKSTKLEISKRYPTVEDMYKDLHQTSSNTVKVKPVVSNQPPEITPSSSNTSKTVVSFTETVKQEKKSSSYNSRVIILVSILIFLGVLGGFFLIQQKQLAKMEARLEQERRKIEESFSESWRPRCGDDGSPNIGEWWGVRGAKSALPIVKNNYCGDAFPVGKNEIQVASFQSRSRAQSFAKSLSQATGYNFWITKSK